MSAPAHITVTVPGHGTYTVAAAALDVAIVSYLPASPHGLRRIVEERTGRDYRDVTEVSSLLVILTDLDFNTDGHPLAVQSVR